MLERGGYLPRELRNFDSKTVFVDATYQADETWYDSAGGSFHPGLHRFVGGNAKVYGAALFRLREQDFGALRHKDGVSPAWPLGYDVFEPYYTQAEALYHVHGQRGEDPTEPWSSAPYAYPPVQHEPRIQQRNTSPFGWRTGVPRPRSEMRRIREFYGCGRSWARTDRSRDGAG